MMRDHWRELAFWRWWWGNRVPFATKAVLALLLLGGILAGGWFAAGGLPSAIASSDGSRRTVVQTVQRIVTVHEHGKVVVHRVPQTRTVYVANQARTTTVTVRLATTAFATTTVSRRLAPRKAATVTTPAKTVVRTVTKTKVKTVPEVQWKVITIVQKPVTVTVTTTAP
jgi:hypothetical protein